MFTLMRSNDGRGDRSAIALLSVVFLFIGSQAHANIVQPTYNDSFSFFGTSTDAGQSFTATALETSLESIGFYYIDTNPSQNAPEITMRLLEGAGFGGALILSVTKTATKGSDHWEDFDFSGTSLVSGQEYTFFMTCDGGAGAFAFNDADVYAGGSLNGIVPEVDIAFRVLGSGGAIPEPTSIASAAIGLLALSRCRRILP